MTDSMGWSRNKPTEPGIYQVRGFNACRPKSQQFVATVTVVMGRGHKSRKSELMCNLHRSTSEDDLTEWGRLANYDDAFEWRGPFVRL